MITALIFAGGTGSRMQAKAIPKQFLEVRGKPIIMYTLELFEANDEIDEIVVVCLVGWVSHLQGLIKRAHMKKVRVIVPGGSSAQESILFGLRATREGCPQPEHSIVLIHDGVRPLISQELITANIESVRQYGSAITVVPQAETMIFIDTADWATTAADRASARVARAPQSFILTDVAASYERAAREGLHFVDSASLMIHYSHKLHTVPGPLENIKITTPVDYFVFRSLLEAREANQIYGY